MILQGNDWLRMALGLVFVCLATPQNFAQEQGKGHLSNILLSEPREQLIEAVTTQGDPVRGALVFYRAELNCFKCHESEDRGRTLGPNLMQRREVATNELIEAVLSPSAKIREGFETHVLALADGRQLTGVVARETENEIFLDRIEEPDQPLQIAIDDVIDRRTSTISVMPEGLANQLRDRKEFLDLVRYLVELAQEGPTRATQLRPATVSFAMAPLPKYENELDHRGLIESWGEESLSRGREIFRLRCASCHGDLENEGSMPTSLRFASGAFKNGSDPLSMYQTLTHGYGMMIPQRWMVPEEKYAVIHYIRETFLRPHNPKQLFKFGDDYLANLPAGSTRGPKPVSGQVWSAMNYGPSLINTIEVPGPDRNIAQKGIAIRLDEGPGGVESGHYWMMFDHDTMRMSGAWSGEFIDYEGIHFNGVHGRHPKVAGNVHFQTPDGPGWGQPSDGSLEDVRLIGRDDRRYGPLPRDWAQYHGMYRHGSMSIIDYQVGTAKILESPGLRFISDQPTFVRSLDIGPRERDLTINVSRFSRTPRFEDGMVVFDLSDGQAESDVSENFNGQQFLQMQAPEEFDTCHSDFSIVAKIQTQSDGTIWSRTLAQNRWVANGQSLFVRGGKLTFDVGWVGAVSGKSNIADGEWHQVAVTFDAKSQIVRLYVDGNLEAEKELAPTEPLPNSVFRLGATNENFPKDSFFTGNLEWVALLKERIGEADVSDDQLVERTDCFCTWRASDELNGAEQSESSFTLIEMPVIGEQPAMQAISAWANGTQVPIDRWRYDESGNLLLSIPSGDEPMSLTLQMTSSSKPMPINEISADHAEHGRHGELSAFTHGGPANWPEVLETEIAAGPERGAFAVDLLTHPADNPDHCRLRMTGLDFVPNKNAMLASTWDGSVWRVDGLDQGRGGKLSWKRFAAGLFQPLGVKYRDGIPYVICRDQIVALHDLNEDGEADWYECFNSDHQVTEHFHEFAMGLQTDADGNFYYAKSARHALPAIVPHHGTLLKVAADGMSTEIIANGFRAANGVCINPDGSFVVTDQEGHWNPKNRINWVKPGGFYGNMFGYHDVTDSSDDAMEPPLCWITNAFDRSPAELLWVDSQRWGKLNGTLLNFSYGYGRFYVVPHENVNGQMQGGMCAVDLPPFATGIMRGRFSPTDGQLYSCGMFAWSSTQEQPGGLYRIRYDEGMPANLPIGLRASEQTITIEFSDPLDESTVNDKQNFAIRVWGLKRTANYGSEHYDEHDLEITSSRLLGDGRTVELEVDGLSPTWCMEIVYVLRDINGAPVENKIHNTIHALSRKND
ncbi:MAG: DUF6797 domain-containing protein [Pirellulaceae bacterium]